VDEAKAIVAERTKPQTKWKGPTTRAQGPVRQLLHRLCLARPVVHAARALRQRRRGGPDGQDWAWFGGYERGWAEVLHAAGVEARTVIRSGSAISPRRPGAGPVRSDRRRDDRLVRRNLSRGRGARSRARRGRLAGSGPDGLERQTWKSGSPNRASISRRPSSPRRLARSPRRCGRSCRSSTPQSPPRSRPARPSRAAPRSSRARPGLPIRRSPA